MARGRQLLRPPLRLSTARLTLFVGWAALVVGCGAGRSSAPESDRVDGDASGNRVAPGGVVSSSDSIATRVAVDILAAGGNAIDAAVACALTLAVTFPEAGNLCGGGFLLAFDPETADAWGLDFREVAPAAAGPGFYPGLDADGAEDPSLRGPLAGGIPGSVAGLHEAWQRGGRLPWEQLVEPALKLARDGFVVGAKLPRSLGLREEGLRRFESTAELFFPGGRPLAEGLLFVQPDLAAILEELRDGGPEPFYRGDIAKRMVDSVRAEGGVWTLRDLADYETRPLIPVALPLPKEDLELLALPPPSSSAVVLGQAMYFLAELDVLETEPEDPERARAVVEALRLAFADRNRHLGDPLSMELMAAELLDLDYLEARARLLPGVGAGSSAAVEAGDPRKEGTSTTHIAVIDADGGAASLTTTINSIFGSYWIIPGTGMFLNNEMDDFDTRPGQPNIYGLVGSGVNAVRPGRRMLSSMSPVLVLRDGEPWLALGARGGPRILSAVLQVLLYRIVDDMSLADAVAAPRVHHQWLPDEVKLGPEIRWPGLAEALAEMGYALESDDTNGKIQAVERGADGRWYGASDSREDGLSLSLEDRGAEISP